MESTTWTRVDPALRAELEAILKRPTSPQVYYSTYSDAMAWWLLLTLACVGGGAAAAWDLASSDVVSWRSPAALGLAAALVVGTWTSTTWVRNHQRRGFALTKEAIVVVRGGTLKILRYADVVDGERSRHGRPGNRFSALSLKTRDGRSVTLLASGTWIDAALARFAG